jgi:hypothetical protein
MGVGTSIFLIAIGAILDFAVKVQNSTHGININRVGLILMIVGIVGLVISLFFWSSWGGVGSYRRRRVTTAPARSYVDADGRRYVERPADYVEERDGF